MMLINARRYRLSLGLIPQAGQYTFGIVKAVAARRHGFDPGDHSLQTGPRFNQSCLECFDID